VDRRSVRRTQRRTLDPLPLQRAVELRHKSGTLRRVARVLAAPLSTVGRLTKLQPAEPVRRYQWAQPGDMIRFATKQLIRFKRSIHRITGDRRPGCSYGAEYEKLMLPSTTPHDCLTLRCCRTRSKQPRWGFCCGPWPGSIVRGSAARGSSPITAAPTAPGLGEKPVQHLVSLQTHQAVHP